MMRVTNPTEVYRHPEMEKEMVRDGNAELISHRDSLFWSRIVKRRPVDEDAFLRRASTCIPNTTFEISGPTYFAAASSGESTAHVTFKLPKGHRDKSSLGMNNPWK
ncbi:MAG: hypothetical protein ACKPKO_36810, partial [Candidatus Fonsibacter sp.]